MSERRARRRPPFAFGSGVSPSSDLRRAISRQTWLSNRAANALHRPVFIGAISVATFVTALVSMIVVPRAQRAPAPVVVVPRPDTLGVIATAAMAGLRLRQADSALQAARLEIAAQAARFEAELLAAQSTDTLGAMAAVRRDTIAARLRQLDRLLARAEQAPLPSSYRALAEVPGLRANVRVRALLDSLADLEREREAFGAVGGVDPIFVALTARASDIGRTIQAIGAEHRSALRTELSQLPPPLEALAPVPAADTVALLATRDSAKALLQRANTELEQRREIARTLDLDEERARERANAVAPPLALLAAAFVLSAVIGFGGAFFGELRRPRVANANELERFLGVRVLSAVETPMPTVDRGRRQADRAAPPYLDPGAEGYQLAYLALATDHPSLLAVTVTGDDQAVVTIVACNLASVAADEARAALVVDLDPGCSASAALRARAVPGLTDLLSGDATWGDVAVAARVGRDKTVDLVPHGMGAAPDPGAFGELLRSSASRLARYYDAVVVAAPADAVISGVAEALPSPDVVYCAQPGVTPLRELRTHLERMRAGGAVVRGIVLWDAPRPLLPMPRELVSRPRAARPRDMALAGS